MHVEANVIYSPCLSSFECETLLTVGLFLHFDVHLAHTTMAHVLDDTDAHSTTPLDLLLNAISGSSAHYPYPDDGPQEDGQEDGQEGLEGEQIALGGLFAREVRNEMVGRVIIARKRLDVMRNNVEVER